LYAGVAQLVERHVANVIVVGSNPITRSNNIPIVSTATQESPKFQFSVRI